MALSYKILPAEQNHNQQQRQHPPADHPSTSIGGPSTSSVSTAQVVAEQEENGGSSGDQQRSREQEQQRIRQSPSGVSYRFNISISNVTASQMRYDVWSCFTVIVTFWFFVSMTMFLGYYGSVSLQLGPNGSRLVKPNPLLVQTLKAKGSGEHRTGPMLYGFYKPPPLDVEITWTQTHNAAVPTDFHKEWVLFLNKGSKVDIFYNVISPSFSPLSLVIAQGSKSLLNWIDDPSYPNTTLSWNIIYGSSTIQQEIPASSTYYIAVGNLNSEKVQVELKFTVKSFVYDISQAYHRCFLGNHLCSLHLALLGSTAAVLTSPGPEEGASNENWNVRLSYGPRWIVIIIGSGVMTVLIMLSIRFCNMCRNYGRNGHQAGEMESERTPLLSHKDDDSSSWGSSYDSNSQEEEDLEKWLEVNSVGGKAIAEGENLRRLCVICFDSSRDCFFLPCGHCAACFTCATRIAEEAGVCPICRRNMKKVRKIFTA